MFLGLFEAGESPTNEDTPLEGGASEEEASRQMEKSQNERVGQR